jgi:hypothetical protein
VRGLVATLVSIALLSCQSAQTTMPSGPAGDVAREMTAVVAPNADINDRPFEELIASLDLARTRGADADAIVEQIRKSRAGATAARTSAFMAGGSRFASVASQVTTFSIPHFAAEMAHSLDPLTKSGGTRNFPLTPYTNREEGEKTFTTTNLSVTEVFTSSKSHVTGTVRWTYTTITIEKQSGATVVHIQDDRELVGDIDVCPDAGGGVPGKLHVTSKIVAQTNGATTTRNSTGDSTFKGTVDEQATLRSVAQQSKIEASWETSSGKGGYRADNSATWNANANGFLGGLDVASISAAIETSGIATATDAAKAAGWGTALDAYALEESYKKAQELWRHGRCVVVAAPDYNAETPNETLEQEKKQHEETVDADSETSFSVKLRHRFDGGSLSAPITAELTGGKEKLEPNRLEGGSGTLKYKAPKEDDKTATARMRSVSKRGIGTLVLEFRTGGALTLTISGRLRSTGGFLGTTTTSDDSVQIGPLEFKKAFGDVWQASGTWQGVTSNVTSNSLSTQTCSGTEKGEVTMQARQEQRGNERVWVIASGKSSAEGSGTLDCTNTLGGTTLRGVTLPGRYSAETDGESGSIFVGLLETIVIPQSGGNVRVHGSATTDRGTFTAEGTATATTSSQ